MFLSHQNIANCLDSGLIKIGPDFDKKISGQLASGFIRPKSLELPDTLLSHPY